MQFQRNALMEKKLAAKNGPVSGIKLFRQALGH
jgi:hypothetical protein